MEKFLCFYDWNGCLSTLIVSQPVNFKKEPKTLPILFLFFSLALHY